jgi:hypothetical protein
MSDYKSPINKKKKKGQMNIRFDCCAGNLSTAVKLDPDKLRS